MSPSANGLSLARQAIEQHSKSFALAARLLPADVRDDAVVLYAFCRRADDAVDLAPPSSHARVLARLQAELDALYAGEAMDDPVLCELQRVVLVRGIPRRYLDDLLDGMRMDADGFVYETHEQLLAYCYRVAGTVGLMMCHVTGVASDRALRHAAHLGMAMQLTNVCRDVSEDWGRGRLYLPARLLRRSGAARRFTPGAGPIPPELRSVLALAIERTLAEADRLYRSGDDGLSALSLRSAWAIRSARLVYAEIGEVLARQGHDPMAGRAVVPTWRKLWLVLRAAASELVSRLRRRGRAVVRAPGREFRYPADAQPLPGG